MSKQVKKVVKKKVKAPVDMSLEKRMSLADKDAMRVYGKPYGELTQYEKIALNRDGVFNYEELEAHVNKLSTLVGDTKALLEIMKRLGIESVEVRGATKIRRAEEEIVLFLRNLQSAMTQERYRDK
jgi:hypothetical protein